MNQQLQTIPTSQAVAVSEWETMKEQAAVLVKAGFLPQSIKTVEQAVAIILAGRELNIPAMAALNNINVIQGKPTISPQLMLALINRSRQLENLEVVTGAEGAVVTMKRKGRAPYVARFGPAEAKAMGLEGKDNYKKQAGTMYQWRAVAMAARTIFPDVILGLYTPEEVGASVSVSETGDMVVEDTQPAVPDFVDAELVEPAEAGDEAEGLRQRARDLCTAMNNAGHSPAWTAANLSSHLKRWYGAESLDALSFDTLTKVVGDFEKKLSTLEGKDEAERSLHSGRGSRTVERAAAQEGAR